MHATLETYLPERPYHILSCNLGTYHHRFFLNAPHVQCGGTSQMTILATADQKKQKRGFIYENGATKKSHSPS